MRQSLFFYPPSRYFFTYKYKKTCKGVYLWAHVTLQQQSFILKMQQQLKDSKKKRDKAFSYTWREFIDGVSFDENTNAIMIKYRCGEDAAEEYLNYISTHSSIATISEIELDEYNYEM